MPCAAMGAAASVERALAKELDQLSREACEELAARHGVALKKSLFSVLGARDGTVAKAAVVRFCQLDALAHGTCGVAAAARAPASNAARKTTCEVVRRTLLAKGSSRLSNGIAATTEAGASPKVTLEVMKEGRARRGTLPRETDAPPDGPRRRRTPSMYLGAPAPKRESHAEKRLRASLRALGAEARIRMHQLETELEKAASIRRKLGRRSYRDVDGMLKISIQSENIEIDSDLWDSGFWLQNWQVPDKRPPAEDKLVTATCKNMNDCKVADEIRASESSCRTTRTRSNPDSTPTSNPGCVAQTRRMAICFEVTAWPS